MTRVLGALYRFVATSLFYLTCLGWLCLHVRMAYIPSEDYYSDAAFCLVLASIVAGFLFLPIVLLAPPEKMWRPDHWVFVIASAGVMLGLAWVLAPDPNPWGKHGVKLHWTYEGSGSRYRSGELSVLHDGKAITASLVGGMKQGWRLRWEELDGDGVKEAITEDDEGRGVIKFVPARDGKPPEFRQLEYWRDTSG